MIEIVMSRELAEEHAAFVAECVQRGHRVEVLEPRTDIRQGALEGVGRHDPGRTTGREGGVR